MTAFAPSGRAALALRTTFALVGSAIVGGIAVAVAGLDPVRTLGDLVTAMVGDSFSIRNSLLQAVPITLTALGVALAFRASLFNLGGEGQIYIGALGGVLVALAGKELPQALLLPAVLVAGTLFGLAWGAISGALRARLGLSEIIVTIMLNYIAFWIVSYLIRGPIQDPNGGGYAYTSQIVNAARMGAIGDTVPVGALLCVGAALVVWVLLERTPTGLAVKDIGESELAARFAGIRVEPLQLAILTVAGALGGLAGVAELSGDQYRVSDSFSPGWGYDAIAVALIGRGSAFGTLAAGLGFGALRSGIEQIQATANVPDSVAQIVQATAVLFLIAANSDVLVRLAQRTNLRLPLRRSPASASTAGEART